MFAKSALKNLDLTTQGITHLALVTSFLAAMTIFCVELAEVSAQEKVSSDYAGVQNTGSNPRTTNDAEAPISRDGGKLKIREHKDKQVHLPAMTGFSGMADSKDLREMLRGLISSQVMTMHQTMMMVENGAATGFIGGMHTVSNLMNNAVQSAQFELELKGIQNPNGVDRLAFANAIHTGMTNQQNKNAWPLGLFWASGDKFKDFKTGETAQNFKPNPNGGAVSGDAVAEVGGGTASTTPAEPAKEVKLVDTLLKGNGAQASEPQSAEWIRKYVGDIHFATEQSKDDPKGKTKVTYVKAEESREKEGATGNDEDKLARGFELRRAEVQKDIWNSTYELLGAYCRFKTEGSNRGRPIFQKETPASVVTKVLIEKTSSPGIKMTINLLDQLFKVFVGVTAQSPEETTKVKCDFAGRTADSTMPDEYKPQEGAAIENCENKPKDCSRNKWLFLITKIIAEDRTIYEFKQAHAALLNGALEQHPTYLVKAQELMCTSLVAGTTGQTDTSLCDPVLFLEGRAELNRQRWVAKITQFSEWAQNIGGGSNLTFSGQNVPNQVADSGETLPESSGT